MDAPELADRLREMYEDGLGRERAVHMAILFGIRYAEEIEACGASVADIVRKAGTIPDSYATEVQKGRVLAEYVTPRDGSSGMDLQDLAKRLRDMYTAGRGQGRAVAMVYLFGIMYAGEIEACGASDEDIVRSARIGKAKPRNYADKIRMARLLAEYVTVRPGSIPEAGHDGR